MDADTRIAIISAFGAHLEQKKMQFGRETELPYPKELIRQALAEELVVPTMPQLVNAMEAAFLHLEDYVSDHEYEIARLYEEVLSRGQRLKDPTNAAAAVDLANGIGKVSGPMLELMKRTSNIQSSRHSQLLKLRALRTGEKK